MYKQLLKLNNKNQIMAKGLEQTDILQRRYTNGQKANENMLNTTNLIRNTQIKTTVRYYFIPTSILIISKMENNWEVEKVEPSYIAGENAIWRRHCGKVWQFLKKLKIELPYDPAIPILHIHPKELKTEIQTNTYTPGFIKALFTRAKRW